MIRGFDNLTIRRAARRAAAGFTLVEMLIVVAIVIILLSLLIVALNLATRAGQRANTNALFTAIDNALVSFRNELDFDPPVLGFDGPPTVPDRMRDLWFPPQPQPISGAFDSADLQEWHSYTTLADYLLGYGAGDADGYDWDVSGAGPPQPKLGMGIRTPGTRDGAWGAASGPPGPDCLTPGQFGCRNPPATGRVYGPHLDLKDDNLLASTDGTVNANGDLNVFFPGEGGYDPDHPKVLCDYWGRPIRYYRQVYRDGFLSSPWRDPTGAVAAPSLADVIQLRPWEVKPGEGTDVDTAFGDQLNDTTSTLPLRTASYALFSSGPDKLFTPGVRRDDRDDFTDRRNEDNLVLEGGR